MKRHNQKGLILIFLAVALVVLVALLLSALYFSQVSLARTRHQNIANLVSLAALKGYMEDQSDTCATPVACHQQHMQAGLTKANQILRANPIPGVQGELAPLVLSADTPNENSGILQFGNYYPEMLGSENPCSGGQEPPCFVQSDSSSTGASAARVALSTEKTSSVSAPVGKLFGTDSFDLKSFALATMVQRCVQLLMDGSLSVSSETHRQFLTADYRVDQPNPIVPGLPPTNSYFAYRANAIGVPPRACTQANLSSNTSIEFMSWCGLGRVRMNPLPDDYQFRDYAQLSGTTRSRPADWASINDPWVKNSEIHYQSDYALRDTGRGQAYVYTFNGAPAEPISSIYRAFNAVTRLMRQNANPIDQAGMLVFGRGTIDELPISQNYGPIVQITNMDLMGRTDASGGLVTPVQEPNFLSRGHITFEGDPEGQTNTVYAFTKAISALNQCPKEARKSIIIATDGMASCYYDARENGKYFCGDWTRPVSTFSEDQLGGDGSPNAALRYTGYGGAYGEGWGHHTDAIYADWPFRNANTNERRSIIDQLVADQISVTSIMSADYLGLNFRNVPDPTGNGFLDFASAAALGWHGRTSTNPYNHDSGRGNFLAPEQRQFFNPMNNSWENLHSPWVDNFGLSISSPNWLHETSARFRGCIKEHLNFESKYGNPFGPAPGSYMWWCDFNTWARFFAGVAPGVADRRPMWLYGEMSMRSGGQFCALMPKCNELPGKNPDPNHWYECPVPLENGVCPAGVTRVLKQSLRGSSGDPGDWGSANRMGTWQTCSVLELTKAEQAEKCALDAIGQNPYMLMKTDGF